MAEIEDNTDKVFDEAQKRALKKLTKITLLVERTAKSPGFCPVKTGTLRRSITHEIDSATFTAIVGTNIEYGIYQELGTSRMAANPYLRPALSKVMQQDVPRIMAEE